VQFEQAEGIVSEFGRGVHCRAGRDYGKRPICRNISPGISPGGVRFGACSRVVGCRVWCHVHRAAGHDHRRSHGEPVDDDD
jgi:hypothetical protein